MCRGTPPPTPSLKGIPSGLRPWLEAAETVTALTVTDAAAGSAPATGAPRPPDGPLAGLEGRITRHVLPPAGDDGATLLAAAQTAGADGLAMGAYRRGRMLEWIPGGVTAHVLHHATLPLLLAH